MALFNHFWTLETGRVKITHQNLARSGNESYGHLSPGLRRYQLSRKDTSQHLYERLIPTLFYWNYLIM